MACSVLFVGALVLGAAGAPASSLRGSGSAAQGRCCFNGCGDGSSCATDHCTSQKQCLSPQPGGGCDSSPPYGQGATPSWCLASDLQRVAAASLPSSIPGTDSSRSRNDAAVFDAAHDGVGESFAMLQSTGVARPLLASVAAVSDGSHNALGQLSGEGYQATFEWYPHATYREYDQCADNDADCFWRCGSGAYISDAKSCTTGTFPLDQQDWFDAVGDDCQTIGSVGARSTDAESIFFGVEKGGQLQSDLLDAKDRLFWPVLALFGSDYCTGPWQEYRGQNDSWEPKDLRGETPGARSFKSYRIYMRRADAEEVEGTLGIKTVFFPYFDMAPYDETICRPCQDEGGLCGGKSLYTPWTETKEWPGLDCVSPDDRVSCFTPGDQMWYATVNGNGGNGYGCVDFAGCTICESGSDQKFCEENCPKFGYNPNDWCAGSPITSLDSYPLGSFYYHLYFSTKTLGDNGEKSYCGDSLSTDDGASYAVCTPGSSLYNKYKDYCVATRFYNCKDDLSCPPPYTCPETANAATYHFTSMKVVDLCGSNIHTGACFNSMSGGHQPDRVADCGSLVYWDGASTRAPIQWPLKTTCYITALVKCEEVLGSW